MSDQEKPLEERVEVEKEVPSFDFNNHLYLIMGPTCSGKSGLVKSATKELGEKAVKVQKYTDRPLRPEEKEGQGDVKSFDEAGWFPFKHKDKSNVIFSYTFGGHEYAIPKTMLDDLEKGQDVFLISTDFPQKDQILEVLPEEVRQKVITAMLYADPSKIKERLESRNSPEEFLKRSQIIENQIADYRSHADEFDYTIVNDMPFREDEADIIKAYHELVVGKFMPLRNFRSAREDDAKDYVSFMIQSLFNGRYANVGELEEAVDASEEGIDFVFDEDKIRGSDVPYELVKHIPKTVLRVKSAHGRVSLVLGNYENFERRKDLTRFIETQTGERVRYTNRDPNYRGYSAFGLLKVSDKETNQPVEEEEDGSSNRGINDSAVFSLTDYVGRLLPDEAPITSLSIAFLRDSETTRLDVINPQDYKARKPELASWELNRGINDFDTPQNNVEDSQ